MDQYLDFITDEAQQPVEESSCVEDEEDLEEIYTPRRSRLAKPWYMRSRKSIVRMIGSNVMWQPIDRRRRKFRDRSIVRMIGSRLPLKPSKRAYFEMFVESNRAAMSKAKGFLEENFNNVKSQLPEIGLADIGLFTWNEFEVDSVDNKSGVITRNTLEHSSLSLSGISNISGDDVSNVAPRCLKRGKKMREKGSSEKKITALEDELANLRAQIAAIVSLQEKASQPSAAMPPPPPPPPPVPVTTLQLPPLPVPKLMPTECTKTESANYKVMEAGVPSMTEVLAGLSNVKLKSANIARSPGGTPLKARSRNRNEASDDPADVIANALRKKFSKARRSIGSPCQDKENQWSPHAGFSPSPVKKIENSSPVTSSPEKSKKSRRRSSRLTGSRIILSPVTEN